MLFADLVKLNNLYNVCHHKQLKNHLLILSSQEISLHSATPDLCNYLDALDFMDARDAIDILDLSCTWLRLVFS